jgi:peptidoglycan L-alanyl-D-glutamate endopeptidase CwlK
MAIKLSKTSLARLKGVNPSLVKVVLRAAELATQTQDFSVLEGVRTKARQKALYAQGRTKKGPIVTWTLNSKHIEGKAVDLIPYPEGWKAKTNKFNEIAALMFKAAKELGVTIRWGADWDRDGKPRERGEFDSPHFELA